ncbi:hypothetical protein EK904_014179 [Melospiza melodia maxima]|nr:hypothetical protein EK904_014179 [Melospiza melodia maxima]
MLQYMETTSFTVVHPCRLHGTSGSFSTLIFLSPVEPVLSLCSTSPSFLKEVMFKVPAMNCPSKEDEFWERVCTEEKNVLPFFFPFLLNEIHLGKRPNHNFSIWHQILHTEFLDAFDCKSKLLMLWHMATPPPSITRPLSSVGWGAPEGVLQSCHQQDC